MLQKKHSVLTKVNDGKNTAQSKYTYDMLQMRSTQGNITTTEKILFQKYLAV
jgi:hypothetical protein